MKQIQSKISLFLVMKFGKRLRDLQNSKTIEPQAITGINRLVCTSKSHNVELKGTCIEIKKSNNQTKQTFSHYINPSKL